MPRASLLMVMMIGATPVKDSTKQALENEREYYAWERIA